MTGARSAAVFRVLQAAAALCFVGHGAFGLITKAAWVPYFGVVGIGREAAYALMPLVGLVDITLGLLVLLRPTRAGLVYMAGWAVWTALLRPLAHQGVPEFLERAGNYGVPIALLLLAGAARGGAGWFTRLAPGPYDPAARRRAALVLRATTATLLLGHGLLAAFGKPLLAHHLAAVGLGSGAADTLRLVALQGGLEIALAAAVLLSPSSGVLLVALAWKVATEMLFPLTGDSLWEFVERGGSYGAPLALLLLQRIGSESPAASLPGPRDLVHHQAST